MYIIHGYVYTHTDTNTRICLHTSTSWMSCRDKTATATRPPGTRHFFSCNTMQPCNALAHASSRRACMPVSLPWRVCVCAWCYSCACVACLVCMCGMTFLFMCCHMRNALCNAATRPATHTATHTASRSAPHSAHIQRTSRPTWLVHMGVIFCVYVWCDCCVTIDTIQLIDTIHTTHTTHIHKRRHAYAQVPYN